jgi:hypothetical protein
MGWGLRNEKATNVQHFSRKTPKSATFRPMTTSGTPYDVHSEARGRHWVAWITRAGATKPERSILLVAASQEEAEARARRWAEQSAY